MPGAEPYVNTGEDRLWLLRAVQVEGEPRELVARALINGFCWARCFRKYPGNLMAWVRSYAQPVNPRWYPRGDLHQLACKGLDGAEFDEMCRRARARETRHSMCTEFSAATLGAVGIALSTAWQSDITDYAAAWIDAKRKGYVARSEPKRGENRMWTRHPGWPGYSAKDDDVA